MKFGLLTVTARSLNVGQKTAWDCVCDCGRTTVSTSTNLTGGLSKSCGCIRSIKTIARNTSKPKIDRSNYGREYYAKNRERLKAKNSAYFNSLSDEKRAESREKFRKWIEANPERAKLSARNARVKGKFGITLEQYRKLLSDQDFKCAICKIELSDTHEGGTKRKALDHDHSTGKIREFLCNGCNTGIGAFRENPDALLAAIEYLKKHKQEETN